MAENSTRYYRLRSAGYSHQEAVEILAMNRAGHISRVVHCGPDPMDLQRHVEAVLRQATPPPACAGDR